MKKLLIALCFVFMLLLAACDKKPTEELPDKPPAFSILQSQTTLMKHQEYGENATFSADELHKFLGETTTYITVTELPDAEKGTLVFNGAAVIKGQSVPTDQLEFLKFVPTVDCKNAEFNFTCDGKGFIGETLECELVFGEGVNAPPVVKNGELKTVSGFTCEGKLSISEPNGDGYVINVITYPTDGFISVSADGNVIYTPKDGFSGSDSLIYTVTDNFGAVSEKATLTINVEKDESNLKFADMEEDMIHLYAHKMCKDNIMVYRFQDGEYYFDPETPVSKMDFLVMMMCVSGEDANIVAVADSAVRDDTGLSSGLKGYLSAAAEKGFIRLDNGRYSPKENITLAEAAFTVSNVLKLPEAQSTNSSENENADYKTLYSAVKAGLIDVAEPSKTLTKADVAELLSRVADYMEENNMN